MSSDLMEQHLALLKALANETRLRLLALIAQKEHSVGSMARSLELTEPTISHHLSKLSEVGLITMRASGTSHFYRLDPKMLRSVGKELVAQIGLGTKAAVNPADDYERRVLQSFVVEGRVTKIPETQRKRLIVLRWLVKQFKERPTYTEREINETIKQFHPDFATIRREFIGHGLMERDNGIYWKTKDRGDVG